MVGKKVDFSRIVCGQRKSPVKTGLCRNKTQFLREKNGQNTIFEKKVLIF